MRYKYTPEIKDVKTNKRKLKTTLYPTIEKKSTDIYIYSKEGDRLDLLSQHYYNDPNKWWIIAQANHVGKGTLIVEPGIRLRIPQNPDEIVENLKNLNNQR